MEKYKNMHRRHRKELIELAKETHEFDWSYLHSMVMLQIKHMHEFYSNGDNVWQKDDTRLSIIEQLNHVLNLDEKIQSLEDDRCGLEIVYDGNNIVDYKKASDYFEKYGENQVKIQDLYEEIYTFIGKNIQNWWD